MNRTAIITFIIAACLVLGTGHPSAAAGNDPAPIAPSAGNGTAPDKNYYAASWENDSCREGRLVYFVDGARFDEVSELPADEENITWGVVCDNPSDTAIPANHSSRF